MMVVAVASRVGGLRREVDRSPVKLVEMYVEAMGARAAAMRMVIGVNLMNDPRRGGSTAELETALREEVNWDQAQVDAYLSELWLPVGMVSVIGHLVDLPAWDEPGPDGEPGGVVDGDVWRL